MTRGQIFGGGRRARGVPSGIPAWLSGAAVGQWVEISGTSNSGAALNAWGTLVPVGTVLVSPANGGHTDSSDNRVASIDIGADGPRWATQIAASASATANTDHMADGKPVSRHGYHHAHYISQRGRVMLFGARGWYSDGGDGYKVDGHSVSGTWAWDAADTWPALASGRGFGTLCDPTTGNVWSGLGWLWTQATNTWSNPGTYTGSIRWPWAYDSTRAQFFGLQWGDGQGFGSAVVTAQKVNPTTGVATTITINASSAYTQFQADQPQYAGMDYDSINDCFLFYTGQAFSGGVSSSDVTQRVYKITPNSGTTWDMEIMTVTGVTPTAGPTNSAGINGRWKYIPELSGFALAPRQTSNLFFLRTA